MEIRRLKKADIPTIRKMHERAGYGFAMPDLGKMEISYVVTEEGKIGMFAGAEMQAEIMGICDPDFGSPHYRMGVMASLHAPIAEQLQLRGVKKATVHLDPKFPTFGKRLSQLGWNQALWDHYWMDVDQAVKALVKRG